MCGNRLLTTCLKHAVAGVSALSVYAVVATLPASGAEPAVPLKCVLIEFYCEANSLPCDEAQRLLMELSANHRRLRVSVRDIGNDPEARARLDLLEQHFKIKKRHLPSFYVCRELILGGPFIKSSVADVEALLTVHMYVRQGLLAMRRSQRTYPSAHREVSDLQASTARYCTG